MIEANINVPFPAKLDTDTNCYSYIDHPYVSASCYAKEGKARKELAKNVADQVSAALLQVKNYRQCAIGTVQGEVFVIQFRHGSWCYSIVGPDRKFGGSCSSSQNYDETVASAKRHIESTFGGIAWECSL
jgi:hypothetical protein